MSNNELAVKLVVRFNEIKGTSYRRENPKREAILLDLFSRGYSYEQLVEVIEKTDSNNIYEVLNVNNVKRLAEAVAEVKKEIVEARQELAEVTKSVTQTNDVNVGGTISILERALAKLMVEEYANDVKDAVMNKCVSEIKEFINAEYGKITRKVEYVVNGRVAEVKGVTHEMFEIVLKFVMANEPVFLVGEAGTGKNVMCKQIADALGLQFYFTNAVTQEYKLTGFKDAMGVYHETPFYKAFTQGGIFMLDEMDASIPEALIMLNGAIANRYFDFPNGTVTAHENFRVISAGNTFGQGASYQYVGRNQLDGASLDRFAVVEIGYSKKIEESICENVELLEFTRDFRKATKEAGIQVITSYRSIQRLSKMIDVIGEETALKTCLTKGLEKDDIKMIVSKMSENNKYVKALKRLSREFTVGGNQ